MDDSQVIELELQALKRALDRARRRGDMLTAELLEAAINNLLERIPKNRCTPATVRTR